MVTPRNPEEFRARVLRRAVQIERRQRRVRLLSTVPIVISLLLAIALVGQVRGGDSASVASSASSTGEPARLTSRVVSIADAVPWSVAIRQDGSLWVLQRLPGEGSFRLGRLDHDRLDTVGTLPNDARPEQVITGVNGDAWMTDPAQRRVLRVRADGSLNSYPTDGTPSASAATGLDGRFWFAEAAADRLTGIAPDGSQLHRALPHGRDPSVVALGPEGSILFGEASAGRMGAVAPSGAVVEYDLDTPSARVAAIGTGPGPAVWFAYRSGANVRLGRVLADGTIAEESVFVDRTPTALSLGPDGRLWFSGGDENLVRQRSLSHLTSRPLDRKLFVDSWALAPDGTMWAVDRSRGLLAKIFSE